MIPISRKRLFTTTVGVILAVAIVFTSYTVGNNMAKYDFYKTLDENPYQITMGGLYGSVDNITAAYWDVKNISHVYNVELSLWSYGVYYENNSMGDYSNSKDIPLYYLLGFNITLLEGHLPEEWNEVALSEREMNDNNWSVGDKITLYLSTVYGQKSLNYTIVGIVKWDRIYYPSSQSQEDTFNTYNFVGGILSLKGIKYLEEQGIYLYGYMAVSVDPEYLLSSTDYNEATNKIEDVKYEVMMILNSNAVGYEDESQSIIVMGSSFTLIFALFFSLPVIVMGAYLSRVGIEIELYERRREFGILKIRGATSTALTKLILIEALLYSVIGGVVGYLLGEGLAYLSNFIFFHMPFFILDMGYWELLGAILFSSVLFLVALSSPFGKIKKEPIISLISHYSQTFKEVEYKQKKTDIALSILFWGYVITAIILLRNVDLNGGFNILLLIAFIILGTFSFMFPVILIVLPLTMSRLLTMGTSKVYKAISSVVAKIFKTSGELAKRSIERSPKRVAYLAFILAFILTLSSFLALAMDNSRGISEIQAKAAIGGDLLIETNRGEIPWDLLNDTKYVSTYVITYYVKDSYEAVYAMDMKKYVNVIYNGNMFLKEGKLDGTGVVISQQYSKSQRIGVGDYIYLTINQTPKQYKVEAIFYSFPGIGYYGPSDMIIIDIKNISNMDVFPYSIIVRSNNLTLLEEKLDERGIGYRKESNITMVDSTQVGLIHTLLLYLVILGSASIVIVQYSSLLNRRGEIALYKVRGAKNLQITAMLMTEGITVIIISLIVGLFIGMLLAYFMASLMTITQNLPEMFFVGWTFLEYTAVILLAYVVSQYILSLIFARTKPSEIIRGLGGEI